MSPEEQVFEIGDLRSDAVDHQREKTHHAKVAAGQLELGRPLSTRQNANAAIRRQNGKELARASHRAHKALKHDILSELPSDSSTNTSDDEETAPPAHDIGVTYSYDAPRGPRRDSHILEMALAKAVERYEGREFERLVREEYEVVSEDGSGSETGKVVEEDFELV
ncbi:hypothetical protein FGG08_002023 [Glutinoglossum americanum]|uniref:Uncharacterized protein n=1 Tax=Glutinoglossum americanum TaxID=1670608 RepID=A0A9P8L4V0_9PEZI|nr:hypothetical protein FGG08_002023 [Glutinoglossum americanum]